MNAKQFSKLAILIKNQYKISYIDAVIHLATNLSIDIEDVNEYIDDNLKKLLRKEYEDLKMIKKEYVHKNKINF